MSHLDRQFIARNVADAVRLEELEARAALRPLRIKAGFDPTAPDLHLGHVVLLDKLRELQEMGHEITFLIGDFTAMIGDPTGKTATRPILTREQVEENAQTFAEQAFKVLDPATTKIRFNSEWFGKMSAAELLQLTAKHTVARMLEREDFSKRFASLQPIAIHEFIYPLLQGYDSVMLQSDLEIGGTDQTFNLLMGRALQASHGLPEQAVITLPILEGIDGVQKMSKSLGNSVGVNDGAIEMITKIMKIPDSQVWKWWSLLGRKSADEIEGMRADVARDAVHPRDAKLQLAMAIATRFHGPVVAEKARAGWEAVVKGSGDLGMLPLLELSIPDKLIKLSALLTHSGLTPTNSEAVRKIREGAVRVDGAVAADPFLLIETGFEGTLQVGKRSFKRVRVS